jgi:hypothetical protein
MTTVLATAADARYGYQLVNLVGSVRSRSDVFDGIVAYDLGLEPAQRRLLEDVSGVEIRTVPPFVPHWREGRTWKTWIWTHLDADLLFWLDAGTTVLRSLRPALDAAGERGYFVVSQGHPLEDSIPADYYELYRFPPALASRDAVAAGIVAFSVGSDFYDRVIVPTHDDALLGRSRGFSPGELHRNAGIDGSEKPPLRDCPHFRWDQTIFNLRFYLGVADPVVADLDEYAGWRSARDHPRQVIWSHRRTGDLPYLSRAPASLRGRAGGLVARIRWWRKRHGRWFASSTYVLKARRLRARRRGRRRSAPS